MVATSKSAHGQKKGLPSKKRATKHLKFRIVFPTGARRNKAKAAGPRTLFRIQPLYFKEKFCVLAYLDFPPDIVQSLPPINPIHTYSLYVTP
jgi:hypothetical protein